MSENFIMVVIKCLLLLPVILKMTGGDFLFINIASLLALPECVPSVWRDLPTDYEVEYHK